MSDSPTPTTKVRHRPFVIRPVFVPMEWVRFPFKNRPRDARLGWREVVHRCVLANQRPSARSRLNQVVNYPKLTDDERWTMAVSHWTRSLLAFENCPKLHEGIEPKHLRRMRWCFAPGYNFVRSMGPHAQFCGYTGCPFCQARRAGRMFEGLYQAYRARPKGSRIWVASVDGHRSLATVNKTVNKMRVAGAVTSGYPSLNDKDEVEWYYKTIAITDDKPRLLSDRCRSIAKPGQLASAVIRHYRLRRLSARPLYKIRYELLLRAKIPSETHSLATYGACREDWVPGKGWLDFAGFEPKG